MFNLKYFIESGQRNKSGQRTDNRKTGNIFLRCPGRRVNKMTGFVNGQLTANKSRYHSSDI